MIIAIFTPNYNRLARVYCYGIMYVRDVGSLTTRNFVQINVPMKCWWLFLCYCFTCRYFNICFDAFAAKKFGRSSFVLCFYAYYERLDVAGCDTLLPEVFLFCVLLLLLSSWNRHHKWMQSDYIYNNNVLDGAANFDCIFLPSAAETHEAAAVCLLVRVWCFNLIECILESHLNMFVSWKYKILHCHKSTLLFKGTFIAFMYCCYTRSAVERQPTLIFCFHSFGWQWSVYSREIVWMKLNKMIRKCETVAKLWIMLECKFKLVLRDRKK